jgi:hypothetical protein
MVILFFFTSLYLAYHNKQKWVECMALSFCAGLIFHHLIVLYFIGY